MKAVKTLPENYNQILSIDLKDDKKAMVLVNLLAIAIGVFMVVPMHFFVSIFTLFVIEKGMMEYLIRFISLMVLMVVYLILHELVHGVAMKICGTKLVKYGFTGLYAFAGSNDYYDKRSYIFIALAPIVVWGIILAIINPLVPIEWFWVVYMIQVINISGAAGDLYVTIKLSRLPQDILVKDEGVRMAVFSKTAP